MDFVLSLVGAVATVAGTWITYLQWRKSRRPVTAASALGPRPGMARKEFSQFAPRNRILGRTRNFVDRTSELRRLAEDVAARKSVLVIEGFMGTGKTDLAARLCEQVALSHPPRWVFCAERRESLSLRSLVMSLIDSGLRSGDRLSAALDGGADPSTVIDQVIEVLDAESLLLVFDDFHLVTDRDVHQLIERLMHSEIRSAVILTTSRHWPGPRVAPLVSWLELGGLPFDDAWVFLAERGVPSVASDIAELIWRKAASGNPQALEYFAKLAANAPPEVLAKELPWYTEHVEAWIAPLYEELTHEQQVVAKALAFIRESAGPELVGAVAAVNDVAGALAVLRDRLAIIETPAGYEVNASLREYLDARLTDDEQAAYAARLTSFYRARAREVFLNGLGREEPSYGLLYLESFPDWVNAKERHIRLVDDLIDRLADNGFVLARGARILVLGSGDGTHDPGFARHGFRITNLDIQPEIAERGRAKATSLPAEISYVLADMTKPLPDDAGLRAMDAVFNIGSSFGYEDEDEDNAAVFHQVASALRPGAPFVFEYVNGPHWESRRVQRQVDVTTLPGGAVRTQYSITNPEAHVSLDSIELRRPDGTGGWFHHFMHYYHLDEVLTMMRDAGLESVAVYGARGGRVTGEPFDERASEAMVIIATDGPGNRPACP